MADFDNRGEPTVAQEVRRRDKKRRDVLELTDSLATVFDHLSGYQREHLASELIEIIDRRIARMAPGCVCRPGE